jgi:hypothetical protein
MTVREGGCLCGAVRYRIEALPTDIAYCHCRMCQKASGAPVMAWATVPASAFAWTRGRPSPHRSSDRAGRLFCRECGSQLVFRVLSEPDRLDITVASLDDPTGVTPEYHIWTSSRLPWFDTTDQLPRHVEEREQG